MSIRELSKRLMLLHRYGKNVNNVHHFNGALLTAYLYVAIPLLLPHKKGTN